MSFLLQHNFKFGWTEATPIAPTEIDGYMTLAKGITSIDPDSDEEVDKDFYYDGGGNSEETVTGLTIKYSFEGHRYYGDEAQDLIFDKLLYKTGPERKGYFAVFYPNGIIAHGHATISGIKAPGGEANKKGDISFDISFDGVPNIVNPTKP